MIRSTFLRELKEINFEVYKIASLALEAIEKAMEAFIKQDVNLATEVIKNDTDIDNMIEELEKKCTIVIATQQPMASDLRLLIAATRIANDIERIADHASDISKLVLKLEGQQLADISSEIPYMSELAKMMFKDVMEAYMLSDIEMAKKVKAMDNKVDQMFRFLLENIEKTIKEKPDFTSQCVLLILIVKYIERIADHATNIAEWIVYKLTGLLKHEWEWSDTTSETNSQEDKKMNENGEEKNVGQT
ncbi:phosphate uptake regulator, PhoU [Caldicellulosiruptor hydrothermalis 108]|uniref:Phosphate-specific transport system accessory protein PhoU n=1 Tax=Caldicellulosiruptor hydrothermalis (strain DSM 18901 / VKM B-2411 / 108) TaxID=632292 RepID=E4Q967_CALH1|nr:phosphate signaling complex protein PhoU [Caldicellulosiruptor hydrothermalis]ADQ08116.1 phosphate uptake regulator, PhoU [Caldicellulosiruptor hydrothermalis 108]